MIIVMDALSAGVKDSWTAARMMHDGGVADLELLPEHVVISVMIRLWSGQLSSQILQNTLIYNLCVVRLQAVVPLSQSLWKCKSAGIPSIPIIIGAVIL